jgi:hypothetical protein
MIRVAEFIGGSVWVWVWGRRGCMEISQGSEVRCRCYLVLRELGGFRQLDREIDRGSVGQGDGGYREARAK